ncbi:hypothetical protein [Acetobacter sp. DsW_54]|uniref:hypothetical protein n=1 Tax=Acetobacter sp. DsW_54 TaxID=1670660 RepID=UPI000A3B5740|nr:hypothetical protein [Acetobacter sp. DsW_54]OUI97613.1 hypothetical protein HK20_12910 [Acetobacter sp. DsW_54]
MTAAEISVILGIVGTVVSLAEKYGPEAYDTVLSAIAQSKSGTGPSDADIAALFAKSQADNAAIQAS